MSIRNLLLLLLILTSTLYANELMLKFELPWLNQSSKYYPAEGIGFYKESGLRVEITEGSERTVFDNAKTEFSDFMHDEEQPASAFWLKILAIMLALLLLIVIIIQQITRDYNKRLKQSVDKRTKELRELNETLETKVEQRTQLLSDLTERYEFAIKGTRDGLWDWDLTTNAVYYSPQWKALIGYADNELENNYWSWINRIHPEDKEKVMAEIQYCLNGVNNNFENIHRLKHKDGHWVWVLDRGLVFYDKDNTPIRMAGFHTDISKLKEAQEELKFQEKVIFQQSKMAAMGEMIENIAHQWRQPLNIIGLSTTQLRTSRLLHTLSDEAFDRDMNIIDDQIDYMSQTINDFRKFFKQEKKKEDFDIADACRDTLILIDSKFKSKYISIVTDISSIMTNGFKSELIQALINILNNAAYQIEQFKDEDERLIIVNTSQDEDHAIITITDSGGGIPDDAKDKIFEPYFTTKHQSIGTGIGLYMTYEIITKHFSGTIKAENVNYEHEGKAHKGARFTVTLPLV